MAASHDDLRCRRQLGKRNETSVRGRCPKRFTTKQIEPHSMVHATCDASDGSDHS